MKIGLLSFQHAANYGAILQTFALKNIIETLSNNNEVYIINRSANIEKSFFKRLYTNIKKIYYRFFEYKLQKFRSEFLDNQTDLINTSEKISLIKDYNFDAVIVGSDQVWRYNYAIDYGYNYYLDFTSDSTKKIAYAASFGNDKWDECSINETNKIKTFINRFDAISVRENQGKDICKNVFGVEAQHLLDPTLIVDKSIYNNLIANCKEKENFNGFIATYILDNSNEAMSIIKNVSSFLNKQPKNIYLKNQPKTLFKFKSFFIKDYFYPSVQYWLKGIKESDFVITDSFHGTIFSIIFKKNFIVIGNKERGISRIQSVLKTFSLEDRLVLNLYHLNEELLNPINYSGVDEVIDIEKNKSRLFLMKALNL